MSIDFELLELARAVEAYDTRLQLMSKDDGRLWFRREIEERREAAAARLAQLEAEHGRSTEEPPAAA